jgi:[protein-PII] uridylyltransferase
MSHIAQRRDISDPDVINEFAQQVGDRTRLNYLYLLTVADVRGTNPTLWNNWKDALFRDLYVATERALRRGLENPLHRDELILDIKTAAMAILARRGLETGKVQAFWDDLPEEYFLRHNVDEVIWHAEIILMPGHSEGVRVDLCPDSPRGGSALFIYTPLMHRLFSRITALLDQLGLTITDARIITTKRNYAIDTYLLLNAAGEPIVDHYQLEEISNLMERELSSKDTSSIPVSRPAERRVRQFKVPTRVYFHTDEKSQRTIVELFTTDYPGLLSNVGRVFDNLGISLQNAKIATFGSQAEDVFYVTGRDDKPLTSKQRDEMREALTESLDVSA